MRLLPTIALVCLATSPAPALAADADVVDWIKSAAIPLESVEAGHGFDDLQPVRKIVGDARVVSLGESTHGTREHFQMKHRMLEFLVSEMGFTVFAIEASLPDCIPINDYVLHGTGDPEKAVAGQGFWTWSTEEVLEMVKWMRRYNQDPSHPVKLKFYGFDMQNEHSAAHAVLKYLARVDPPAEAKAREALKPLLAGRMSIGEGSADDAAKVRSALASLREQFRANRAAWEPKTDPGDFAIYARCIDVCEQALELGDEARGRASSLGVMRDMELMINGEAYAADFRTTLREHYPAIAAPAKDLLDALEDPAAFARQFTDKSSPEGQVARWTEQAAAVRKALLEAKDQPDAETLAKARRLAGHVNDLVTVYAEARREPPREPTYENVRDKYMAANVAWILETEGPSSKVVCWAHNGHVMMIQPGPRRGIMTQGQYMEEKFGDGQVVFGFAFGEGAFQAIPAASFAQREGRGGLQEWTVGKPREDSADAVLAAAGIDNYVLDLRAAPKSGPVADWLATMRPMRMAGAVFDPSRENEQYYRPIDLDEAFDAIIFTSRTTRARPLATMPHAAMNPDSVAARPRLGVQLQQESADEGPGLLVLGLMPGYAAEAAGIRKGDRILKVGEVEVKRIRDLPGALAKYKADDVAPVTILRDENQRVIDVRMIAPKASTATRPSAATKPS